MQAARRVIEIVRKQEELVGQVSRVTDLMELLSSVKEHKLAEFAKNFRADPVAHDHGILRCIHKDHPRSKAAFVSSLCLFPCLLFHLRCDWRMSALRVRQDVIEFSGCTIETPARHTHWRSIDPLHSHPSNTWIASTFCQRSSDAIHCGICQMCT